MATTLLSNLIDPEVMGPMISAKAENKLVVAPFAKVDTTLQGQPGSVVTVPRFDYIGDAVDVAEGVEVDVTTLTTTSTTFTIKKAMKAIELTDEAVLSGYGNPVGEGTSQLGLAIAQKVDGDALTALLTATLTYDGSAGPVGYDGIVNAIDVFDEEFNSDKVMFVNPKQVTQLRLDPDFLSADKYQSGVAVRGEIGMIANTRIVPTRKVVADETTGAYVNPIVKLNHDGETEDEAAALTVYLKRDTNVETERFTLARKTAVSADRHYGVALTNASKVVLATFAG